MARPAPSLAAPGDPTPGRSWLVELLAPRPAPVPWSLAAEAALAVGGSFGIGVLSGHTVDGLLASLGALPPANVDRGGPTGLRLRRMGAAGVATAVGLVVGAAARGTPWQVVASACVVAAVAGLVSSLGPVASVFGLFVLVYTIIAALDPLPGPAWRTALVALAGAGWKVAISLAARRRGRASPERRAVAAAFDAVADALAGAGGPSALGRRQAMTAALNAAEDAVVSLRTGLGGPDTDTVALLRSLEAAMPLAAAATDRVATGRPAGAVAVGAVRDLAALVRAGPGRGDPGWGPPQVGVADADLRRPLAAAGRVVAGTVGDETAELLAGGHRRLEEAQGRHPRPLGDRLGDARARLAAPRSVAAAGRLVLCIAAAEVCATSLGGGRPYWIPLTVAVALKPDFGSVFARAVQRAVGTAAGVVVGGAVMVAISDRRQLVPVLVVLAALLPVTIVRNYGMFVTVLTPLVLVQIDALTPSAGQLVGARLLDTLVGCAVVLVLGFGVWPSTWRPRLTADLEAGVGAVTAYLRAPGDAGRRRAAYRRLSDLRTTWSQHFADPSPTGVQARSLWPAVIDLEQVLDRAVALHAEAHRQGGAPGDDPHAGVGCRLEEVADALTAAAGGVAPVGRAGGADDLDDLVAGVAAAVQRAADGPRLRLRPAG